MARIVVGGEIHLTVVKVLDNGKDVDEDDDSALS